MKSILPSGPLKTKFIIINYNNHDKKPIYNSFTNWEMLKTEVNTLVKKVIQSTMILKKAQIFKNQNNFLNLKFSTL